VKFSWNLLQFTSKSNSYCFHFSCSLFQVMILMMDHLLEFTILNVIIYNTTMVIGWSTWPRMCSILYLYDKGKKLLAYYACWKCVISPWQFLIIFQILYVKWKMNRKNLVLLFVRLLFSSSLWSSLVKIVLVHQSACLKLNFVFESFLVLNFVLVFQRKTSKYTI